MFESLLSDDRKGANEQNGMERISVRSENGQFEEVDTDGSALISSPSEELEEVESSKRTTEEGIEIIELSTSGEPVGESDLMRESLSIDPESESASKFFTEEELSELKSHQDRFSQEDIDSVKKTEKAIQDPEIPAENRSELWDYLCELENKGFYSKSEEEYPNQEAKMLDEIGDRDWVEPENPENRKLSELEGHEFKELMREAQGQSEEELSQSEEDTQEQESQEEEIDTVPEELAEAASEAWSERGGIWEEFAEDITVDVPDTQVTSISEEKMQIETTNSELAEDLVQAHKSEKWDTTLKKENGKWVAKVPKEIEV